TGDLKGAVAQFQESLEFARKSGQIYGQAVVLFDLAVAYLQMGDLENAEWSIRAALDQMEAVGHQGYIGSSYHILGTALLGQGLLDPASEAFGKADQI